MSQCGLLSDCIPKGTRDKAALAADPTNRLTDPSQEVVDERRYGLLTKQLSLVRRQLGDERVALEDGANTQHGFSAKRILGSRSLPEVTSAMSPTRDLDGGIGAARDCVTAKESVVHRVSVGLNESRIAEKHWADRGAGVLGLILEEDVVAIGEDDEEVALFAGRWRPVIAWGGLNRDACWVGGQAERAHCVLGHGADDCTECGAAGPLPNDSWSRGRGRYPLCRATTRV